MEFYTNAIQNRGDILLRGYKDGKRVMQKIKYKPYLFMPSEDSNAEFKDIKGKPVDKVQFNSIGDARNFTKRYKDVSGFEVLGMTHWQYVFLYDRYGRKVKFDKSLVRIAYLDIETDSSGSFPNIKEADKEINAVTIRHNKLNITLGFFPYTHKNSDTTYIQCKDEKTLLNKLIDIINKIDPDIVTGWNSSTFDIPYITNRCLAILGEVRTKDLSPWKIIERREVHIKGKSHEIVSWAGIACLDYIDVYKKFRSATAEMYSLEYISNIELGVGKLDYSEYETLDGLYKGNTDLYYEYNIVDVERIDQIEDKLQLFNILMSLAYLAGCNYQDTFGTVKPWDVVTHNYLMDKKIVVPSTDVDEEGERIEGGYVKDFVPGLHKWVVSFDVNSLYPSLIRQCNISPESIITTVAGITVQDLLHKKLDPKLSNMLVKHGAGLAATGCLFDNSQEGFIPAIMTQAYNDRVKYNDEYKSIRKKLNKLKESNADPATIDELEAKAASLYGMQYALKILLNSGYGALSNRFYRWYDTRLSESTTKTGQLTVQWVSAAINIYLNKLANTENIDYVTYCDTDSAYISMNSIVKLKWPSLSDAEVTEKLDQFCKNEIEKVIDDSFKELTQFLNHREYVLVMKRENIASRAFWTAKKRYAMNVWDSEGTRYASPKPKVQGLESIKNSVPRAMRGLIGGAISIMLNETEPELIDYISKVRVETATKGFVELATTKSVSNIYQYMTSTGQPAKGCPINTRAALTYNNMVKSKGLDQKYVMINEGDKLKYCYLIMPNPVNSNVIGAPAELPKEFGLESYIDHHRIFEDSFLKPVQTMANSVGWNTEKKPTLEDLFEY